MTTIILTDQNEKEYVLECPFGKNQMDEIHQWVENEINKIEQDTGFLILGEEMEL